MDEVQSFLLQREDENNLALGLMAAGGLHDAIRHQGIRGVVVHLGRRSSLSLADSATLEDLERLSGMLPASLVSITGPGEATRQLALRAATRLKRHAVLKDRMRLYRLDRVLCQPQVAGQLVRLDLSEESWLAEWMQQFYREALPFEPIDPGDIATRCRSKLEQGVFFGWQRGAHIVSVAAFTRPSPRGVCLSSVFTPLEFRGSGYASAVSAALSQLAFDSGKSFCVLYADLDNPTSNSIYQKIGYRAVAEHHAWYLEGGSTSEALPHPR